MEKYSLHLHYMIASVETRLIIRVDAESDDEALRISNAVADLAVFEGATALEITVVTKCCRDVGTLQESSENDDYLDRPIRYGSGYHRKSEN